MLFHTFPPSAFHPRVADRPCSNPFATCGCQRADAQLLLSRYSHTTREALQWGAQVTARGTAKRHSPATSAQPELPISQPSAEAEKAKAGADSADGTSDWVLYPVPLPLHRCGITTMRGQGGPCHCLEGAFTDDSWESVPLCKALHERTLESSLGGEAQVSLHIPGHKRGARVHPALRAVLGSEALKHDLTELEGLDYLSSPTGAIAEAQARAAAAFGADQTWFLVNGTTVGIQAAVLATCGPGDTLLLARNCHASAFSAMVLAGCKPLYIAPLTDSSWGVAHGLCPADVAAALRGAAGAGRRVNAVLLVSPTYFGYVSDIPRIAAVCHEYGAVLIVDEAHGAHSAAQHTYGKPALGLPGAEGADIAVQSTHKMLPALTQASMLHVRGPRVSRNRISKALHTLQSSSPSYLLLASLDAASAVVSAQDFRSAGWAGALSELKHTTDLAHKLVGAVPGVHVMSLQTMEPEARALCAAMDPWKLALRVDHLTGTEVARVLEEKYGVVAELSTPVLALFAFGYGSRPADGLRLVTALEGLQRHVAHGAPDVRLRATLPAESPSPGESQPAESPSPGESQPPSSGALPEPIVVLNPRDAFFADTMCVDLKDAAGEVCAELLSPYPPGVPVVCPGERLTPQIVALMRSLLRRGGKITGASDESLTTILVIRREAQNKKSR